QLRLLRGLTAREFVVLDPAVAPARPLLPARRAAFAGFFFLLAGASLAGLALLDSARRNRDPAVLAHALGLPVLARVPAQVCPVPAGPGPVCPTLLEASAFA